jgi:hypothetical protein
VGLKVNDELLHFKATKDYLAKAENMLAVLTNAELEHRERLQEGLQNLVDWAGQNPSELNPGSLFDKVMSFLGPDSPVHKCSEKKMQIICGRRAECIEIRRERILKEINNINLKTTLRDIPPSTEHLFSRDDLQPVIQSLGGLQIWLNNPTYLKEKNNKSERSSTGSKQYRKSTLHTNRNTLEGKNKSNQNNFQKRNRFRPNKKNGNDNNTSKSK